MSRVLLGLSRFVFVTTLVAAPWAFSGRPLLVQERLALGMGASFGLLLLSRLFGNASSSGGWNRSTTALAIVWCGFIGLGVVQLLGPQSPGWPAQHAVVLRTGPEFTWPSPEVLAGTQSTFLTRTQLARLVWPLMALILGSQLYADATYRRGFFLLVAMNGAALSLFGIVQRLTWNEKIFWVFAPPHHGQPFASFWNRNHAAGYLNFCLAAAIGLLIAGMRQSSKEWWPPRSADDYPTWRAAFVQLLVMLVPLGVIATASRGGILGSVVAFVVVIALAIRTSSTAIIRHLTMAVLAGSILAVTLGMWQLARSRFDEFSLATVKDEARWRHWSDMVPALQDVWRTGTGLGTYRYANRPYQNHAVSTTYWNADNEYLELAIEGGLPAVLLLAMGGGTLLCYLGSVCRADWLEDEATAELGPVMAFLVISQGLQAATDYGISIPANALTGAAMLGVLTIGRLPEIGETEDEGQGSPWPWWAWILALLVSAGAIVSYREISSAATAGRFLESVPEADSPALRNWSGLQLDAAIARAESLQAARPDDFELLRCGAVLHLHRYRRELTERLQNSLENPQPLTPDMAWAQTHAAMWDAECRIAAHQGNTDALDAKRQDAAYQRDVPAAYRAFQRAQQLCPFDAPGALNLAMLSYLCGNGQADRTHGLRLAILSSPADPKRLRSIAGITEPVLEDDLAAFCWRRAIELDPKSQDEVYREATQRLSPAFTLENVVKPDAPSLLRFAEVINDPFIQSIVTERLTEVLNESAVTADGESWMQLGRLSQLQGQNDTACAHFRKAVQMEPLRWEFRLRYALALEIKGDIAAAREQVQDGLRFAPKERTLLELQKRLHSR